MENMILEKMECMDKRIGELEEKLKETRSTLDDTVLASIRELIKMCTRMSKDISECGSLSAEMLVLTVRMSELEMIVRGLKCGIS